MAITNTTQNVSSLVINKVPSANVFKKMKDQNLINENELYLVDGSEIDKYTFTATAGQNTFTIPFEFDGSSSLTLYYNGVMMKEDDNYTIAGNVITLVDWTAEEGDYITVMGIQGAAAIDFAKDADKYMKQMEDKATEVKADLTSTATTAKNDITSTASTSKTEINTIISTGKNDLNNLIDTLPDNWNNVMDKNSANVMGANGKITMNNSYVPSGDNDLVTMKYVSENSYKVGDTLTTARTDLGDDWLLCNGASVDNNINIYNLLPKEDYTNLNYWKPYGDSTLVEYIVDSDTQTGYYIYQDLYYTTDLMSEKTKIINSTYFTRGTDEYLFIMNNICYFLNTYSNKGSHYLTAKYGNIGANNVTTGINKDYGGSYGIYQTPVFYYCDNKFYGRAKNLKQTSVQFSSATTKLSSQGSVNNIPVYWLYFSNGTDSSSNYCWPFTFALNNQMFVLRQDYTTLYLGTFNINTKEPTWKIQYANTKDDYIYSTYPSFFTINNNYYVFVPAIKGIIVFFSQDLENWNSNFLSTPENLTQSSYVSGYIIYRGQLKFVLYASSTNSYMFDLTSKIFTKIVNFKSADNINTLEGTLLRHNDGNLYSIINYKRYLPTVSSPEPLYTYIKAK